MSEARGPVVVLGMIRSGTTMLTRMLSEAGVHIGRRHNPYYEADFFYDLNTWLLHAASGRWDRPELIDYLLRNAELRERSLHYLEERLSSRAAARSLGFAPLPAGGRGRSDIPSHWGWKDPRNTFTLEFWLELFPGARVLHIYRHGVDSAASQRARERSELASAGARNEKARKYGLYRFRAKRGGFNGSPRCLDLAGGFSLWQSYIERAFSLETAFPDLPILHVRYEDFLENPVSGFSRVLEFCELEAEQARVVEICADVDAGRRFAWRNDPELCAFAESVRTDPWMTRLGYGVSPEGSSATSPSTKRS